jgi:hypothetical protein
MINCHYSLANVSQDFPKILYFFMSTLDIKQEKFIVFVETHIFLTTTSHLKAASHLSQLPELSLAKASE